MTNPMSLLRKISWTQLLAATSLLVVTLALVQSAQPQSFTVLHTFTGPDGEIPEAGLVRDKAGNFYGTTYRPLGVIFRVDTAGKETVLYSFSGGKDGSYPTAGLVLDASGNLYGTSGGDGTVSFGSVFKLSQTGQLAVLHSFTGGKDGGQPYAGVVRDSAGNLYGTTLVGGNLNDCAHGLGCGTVFKVDKSGHESVLYSFTGGMDGYYPLGGVVRDDAGNLYGTTLFGGDLQCYAPAGCGVVFKLDTSGHESVLHRFAGGKDGAEPTNLIRDKAGNLYGTTYHGGNPKCSLQPWGLQGCGTVFKLNKSGHESVLYRFTGGANGAVPGPGALILDKAGNMYGTSLHGAYSSGIVYKVNKSGQQSILYSFTGKGDGLHPNAPLVRDSAGSLYGTTQQGGTRCNGVGCGVVFKLTP